MTWDRVLVNLIGLGLVGGIVWFFWLVKTKGVGPRRATAAARSRWSGQGRYTPTSSWWRQGSPCGSFVRQESASCTEMVLLELRQVGAPPEGAVPVEFLPKERRRH